MKIMWCWLILVAALLDSQHAAFGFCGFFAGKADASLFNQASQVVVVRDGPRTVLSMLNDYQGPLDQFALVVPTPTALQRGQVRVADPEIFARLDAYSSPRLAEYFDRDPCQMNFTWGAPVLRMLSDAMRPLPLSAPGSAASSPSRDRALGVTVEARYTLEEYDIVSLSATQSDGLETWLQENGYKIPKGASAALKPYINMGMKFFVAKVNLKEQKRIGYTTLRPLQFAYQSEKFMLPLRLGMLNAPPDQAQDLIVYALTKQGRVETSNYRTVKLPANLNLPFFIKPKFADFYRAMFGEQARKEDQRVVFTEYFWNMGWCDPCAAEPLNHDELKAAGVFWLDGDASTNATFEAMSATPGAVIRRPIPAPPFGGQPVQLTRLHVRYTARTFPEDLMFTQTQDQSNWQARYVIQNPYQGTAEECDARIAAQSCEEICRPRVDEVLRRPTDQAGASHASGGDALGLTTECVSACVASKQDTLTRAARYYQSDLPSRLMKEKQTLAELTGWSMQDIDALPDARRYALGSDALATASAQGTSSTSSTASAWWLRLFKFVTPQ